MVVRPASERPVVLAVRLADRQVVDAGDAPLHVALGVELPVLVAVGAEPVAGVVVPFVGEAHGDAVVVPRPELLDEPVVELLRPLAGEERHDRLAALDELRPVAPDAVHRIRAGDSLRLAGIPGVFGRADLLRSGLFVERRKRRTGHGGTFLRESRLDGAAGRRVSGIAVLAPN